MLQTRHFIESILVAGCQRRGSLTRWDLFFFLIFHMQNFQDAKQHATSNYGWRQAEFNLALPGPNFVCKLTSLGEKGVVWHRKN